MAFTQESHSDLGWPCRSRDQATVSTNRDHILIPHKALLDASLTPSRQSKDKGRTYSSTFESVDQVLKDSSPRHPPKQDFYQRDSKLLLGGPTATEAFTKQYLAAMPPSPPQTPTGSSVYSRSAMDTPSAPKKKSGRTVVEFPRFERPLPHIPRRPRIVNVRHLPGRYDREKLTFTHNKTHEYSKDFEVVSGVFPKPAHVPKAALQKPASSIPFPAIVAAFTNTHLAMPCVTNSLKHALECGHTICTAEPEMCASNCRLLEDPALQDPSQLKDLDTRFECMQCFVDHIQEMQYGRITMMTAELAERAKKTGQSSEWVANKLGFLQIGWSDEDIDVLTDLRDIGKGRRCRSLHWIEPEMQNLVDKVNKAREKLPSVSSTALASPISMCRPAAEPTTPTSRVSIEDRTSSRRSSISSNMTTESKATPTRWSVKKLFAAREKKDSMGFQPSPAKVADVYSIELPAQQAQDTPERDEVTMEFE